MKILLYAAVDLSLPGGVETHVRELALGLTARGHAVEIFGRPATLAPFTMVSSVEPSRYDMVHHHGGTWPRGLEPGPHYVRTFHFSVAEKMRVYVGLGRLRTLLNAQNWRVLADERASTRRAAALIAVSARLAGELAQHHGVPRERIEVIPNGASFDAAVTPRAALRARYGIAADTPVLLTIGRDDFVKGYDLLTRAWRGVRVSGATWVQVGGEAPRRAAGRVVTGTIARQEALDWTHAADVGAFPSYYEGGGIVLLDYQAAGLYTLTHEVGNAAEVIRAGTSGEILPRLAGAWTAAITRALGVPARPRFTLPDAYRWPAVVARVEAVYRTVLARG